MAQSDQQEHAEELIGIVRSINDACLRGTGFEEVKKYFHEEVVIVAPGFSRILKGRDPCLKTYEDACALMTFHKLDMFDERVDVYGSTAVVSYRYDCTWEQQGKRLDEDGREILVFHGDEHGRRIAWRTLLPGTRRSVAGAGKGDEDASAPIGTTTAATDLQRHCLDLVHRSAVCQLTTLDEQGYPHTTAMNNLRNPDNYPSITSMIEESGLIEEAGNPFLLYFSTHMESYKVARIRKNPRVSAYFCDADQFKGLMLGGEIEIVQDKDLKDRLWQEGWHVYYPSGPDGHEYGILRLKPVVAKGWYQAGPFELKFA